MSCLSSAVRSRVTSRVQVQPMTGEDVMARAEVIARLDLKTVRSQDLQRIQSDFDFSCFGTCTIHGFLAWFSVLFPGGTLLSTSPYEKETHWQQSLMYLKQSVPARQD